MSRLEDLPPDQQATLSLLLGQRKTYAEVAGLLGIPERAVRDRAHAALAVLAPSEARVLSAKERGDVSDYLLSQTGVAERLATRTFLEGSQEGRDWGRAISTQIASLSAGALPQIPDGASPLEPDVDAKVAAPVPTLRDSAAGAGSTGAGGPGGRGAPPSSRLGGALLLAAIAAGVIVAIILLTSGGGSSHPKTTAASTSTASSTTSSAPTTTSPSASTGATGPTVSQRINLTSPNPQSKSAGAVEIISEGTKHAYFLAAEHLPPSSGFFYAVWLYNSPTSHEALNRSPAVGSNGQLTGGSLLPANASTYRQILLTQETSNHPTHPGPVVLSGPFSLGH